MWRENVWLNRTPSQRSLRRHKSELLKTTNINPEKKKANPMQKQIYIKVWKERQFQPNLIGLGMTILVEEGANSFEPSEPQNLGVAAAPAYGAASPDHTTRFTRI